MWIIFIIFIICSQHRIWTDFLFYFQKYALYLIMIVLKHFNTVFINIYNNVFMSKIFWTVLFGGQIFSPSSVNRPALLSSEKPFTIYLNYLHTRISAEEWIDSINYLIKISVFLVFIIFELVNLTLSNSARWRDTASWRLIDQVDRERGTNRNQSRGI